MVSTHVFFVRVRRGRGRDKKSSLLFPELQQGGNHFYRKKGLVSTKANLLSLHMLCLENNNWVSFIFFPLLSCPGSNCNDSAVSSSLCAVNSWPFHLRSLNDLKKEKRRGKKQGGGIIISSPCDHPCFTSSASTTHLCEGFYMLGPSCKGNWLSQACSQSAVHPSPPRHFAPLVFEHAPDVTLTRYCLRNSIL